MNDLLKNPWERTATRPTLPNQLPNRTATSEAVASATKSAPAPKMPKPPKVPRITKPRNTASKAKSSVSQTNKNGAPLREQNPPQFNTGVINSNVQGASYTSSKFTDT